MLPKFPSGGGKRGFSSTWSSYLPYVDTFKKRACRFILHHYLGRFLKDHLTLDQLTIDLYNGTGSLHNVPIDIYSVNDVLESQGIPVELVSGDIATITVSIPWSNIFQNASKVEIHSLTIAIKGQSASSDSTFLTESYFNTLMTTSFHLAKKCLNVEDIAANFDNQEQHASNVNSSNPTGNRPQQQQGEALEFFAQAIETVLLKVRISLVNTKIRFEPSDPYSDSIEIEIGRIDFFDDSVGDDESLVDENENTTASESEDTTQFFTSNFSTKVFKIEGMSINHVPNACNINKVMTEVLTTEELHSAMGRDANGGNLAAPVKIGEFLGKVETKVKMKQNPHASGAKLSVECLLGSLSLFTQPKHIKVIIDVLDGFINSSAPNTVHVPPGLQSGPSTGMTDKSGLMFATCQFENDISLHQKFSKIGLANELGERGRPSMRANESLCRQGLNNRCMDSMGGPPGVNNASAVYNDEDFYSIYDDNSEHNSMTSSMISGTTTTATTHVNDQRKRRDGDSDTEPTLVNIRLNGFSLVLLEATNEDFDTLSKSFYEKFHQVTNFMTGFGPKDVYEQKKLIQSACNLNHITLLACPVNARLILNQSKTSAKSNALLTFAFFELTECLNTPTGRQESTILTFANQKQFSPNGILAQPNMKVEISWSNDSKRESSDAKKRVAVLLDLMPTVLNLDLTLLDRLIEFFECSKNPDSDSFAHHEAFVLDPEQELMSSQNQSPETSCCFELRCSELELTFYIPIPIFDEETKLLVSTQRIIRNEAFLFNFTAMSLKFDFTKVDEDLSVCLETNCIEMFLVSNLVSLKLCRIGSDQRSKPYVSFKLYPFHGELESANTFDMNTASMYDSFPCDFSSNSRSKKSPFSSKVIIHNSQPVVKCGTHKELRDFAEDCLADSRLVLKISLPLVSLFIPNKAVFDLIYNRFSNDLLLWEPLFSQKDRSGLSQSGNDKVGLGLSSQAAAVSRSKQHFSMCKSGIRSAYGNWDQNDEEGGNGSDDGFDTSTMEDSDSRKAVQNWLSLQVKFGTVKLALSDVNKMGERGNGRENNASVSFQSFSDVKNGSVFVVCGHGGCPSTTFLTFACFDGQCYHSEEDVKCVPFSFDDKLEALFPSYMDLKLRKSRLDLMEPENQDSFSNPLLSLAVKIHANRPKNFKHIKVALNAEGVTLVHRFDQKQWYEDLIEMFSPKDEPIPGYKFLPVCTELHLSLTNCAVMYRPLHLPYTVLLNTGCCYLSSNVVADATDSIFQIIVEGASLYISCSRSLKSRLSDFAKMVETGLVSLEVITKKVADKKKKEIRLSCDILNVYTCSDSLKVFFEVIQYLAANGDCPGDKPLSLGESSQGAPPEASEMTESPRVDESCDVSSRSPVEVRGTRLKDDIDDNSVNLNQMIQSAINEDLCASVHPDYTIEATKNAFFFPDDSVAAAKPVQLTENPHSSSSEDSAGQSADHVVDCEKKEYTKSDSRAVLTLSPSDSFEGGVEGLLVASQFCVIESPFVRRSSYEGECSILFHDDGELKLVEEHFAEPISGKRDRLKSASYLPDPVCKYNIQEFNISWKLYAGNDFPSVNGMQFGRDKSNSVEVCFQKIELLYDRYDDSKYLSRLAVACDDVEILDRIAASSINKMLYCYSAENCLRQAHSHMVMFKYLECVPSELTQEGSEYIVRLNLLPIRLNFDQRTVFFLSDFFSDSEKNKISLPSSDFGGEKAGKVQFSMQQSDGKRSARVSFKNTDASKLKVELPGVSTSDERKDSSSRNCSNLSGGDGSNVRQRMLPTSCKSSTGSPLKSRNSSATSTQKQSTSFIKEFTFLSDVMIKFDYHGKYFDMDRGKMMGLLVGLAQVQCSHLVLKRLEANHGILGFDNLAMYCVTEWLRDIKKNQIPTLLGGIGPMHSFSQIMNGLVDLVCMPIEQYRRDGRLLKGFQRGAASFTTSSTSAALQLTNRLISAIQFTAETAFDLLSPNPRSTLPAPHSRHSAQPNDFREGLNMAYRTLYEGLNDTAITLVREAVDGRDTRGLTGAVGGVLRQIPPTLIAPVILASEATSTVIDGVSHQLAPDSRNEALCKWKY